MTISEFIKEFQCPIFDLFQIVIKHKKCAISEYENPLATRFLPFEPLTNLKLIRLA